MPLVDAPIIPTSPAQQHIALADRHLELFRKVQQHLAARMGSVGFHKAQMPGRDPGVAGEIKLAEAPALPPLAQQSAYRLRSIEHAANLSGTVAEFKLPRR